MQYLSVHELQKLHNADFDIFRFQKEKECVKRFAHGQRCFFEKKSPFFFSKKQAQFNSVKLQGDRQWKIIFKTHKLTLFVLTTQILAWFSMLLVKISQSELTTVL